MQGEKSSRVAGLRQKAGRAQSKSRRERQVVRLLMWSETFFLFFFSMQISGHEESVVRNLSSWSFSSVAFLGARVIVMCSTP